MLLRPPALTKDGSYFMTYELKTDVLYGINPVLEALRAGKRKAVRLFLSDTRHDKYQDVFIHFAKELNIPIAVVPRQELFKLSATDSHQGVAGVFGPYPYSDIQPMLDRAENQNKKPFIIALDEMQDPHNTGAIIRTASCLGFHGIILTKRRSADITPAVVKASSGATEYMHIALAANLRSEIESLKENGLTAVGLDMQGNSRFNDVNTGQGMVLIVGSEGSGIRKPVIDVCDYVVSITMNGHPDSLNASVSAGIAMYELGNLSDKKRAQ